MSIKFLNIENIRSLLWQGKVDFTKHCLNRLNQREIAIRDVKHVIKNGIIIEYYFDDYPYPSCLILGKSINNKNLHIVCGISSNLVHVITAYYPDDRNWKEDMKTRRDE